MSDQAPAQRETFDADNAVARQLPAWGEPRINGINRIGLWSLYRKEVRRFFKVQTQTVWAPAFTTLLFLVIFSVALGRGGREILGVPFESFLAPGLIVMAMMQNSFANSSFSFLSGKIQGTIIDLLIERGADVSYHDPHCPDFPEMRHHDIDMHSVDLDASALRNSDCVLIITDHSSVDYAFVGAESGLVVDSRNAMDGIEAKARIVKA